ncbi:Multisubunit Na+/H+ antiporter MnhF subunit [Rubrobacter radiotolerans]|uniref:Monovalent cation/H+ antiporter complex subunit F n=1 Tax=Rubrobacter radiotolerans TaxID=42256 RepID=A0A023X1Q0_RUBRA|nr:monovalent cation/H+ antiporter complex subunit F [Rubrobacter radiotolerans]AHY46268.1 Multisubunit Na+/H+ antiporter MnhF subunit [Rubrobacter radiotolerans]MDX5893676.1 monovalent cation/H+ antiporter complex subunit F [Rubrobacter radiotolerans]SMC04252.1 multicomponent Na+:H+ antiporter subunit F [Rubrobacter radiotolerans DSM 5868]
MTLFYTFIAVFLLASILAGLVRVFLGPTPADRMLSAQLFGTTGVAILLLLALALGSPALVDVALALGLLAAVATVAFVLRVPQGRVGSGEDREEGR